MGFIFVGIIILGIYDTKKKNEVKFEKIRLECEKVALEQTRMKSENQ